MPALLFFLLTLTAPPARAWETGDTGDTSGVQERPTERRLRVRGGACDHQPWAAAPLLAVAALGVLRRR